MFIRGPLKVQYWVPIELHKQKWTTKLLNFKVLPASAVKFGQIRRIH